MARGNTDKELILMSRVKKMLDRLDVASRFRVLDWLRDRYLQGLNSPLHPDLEPDRVDLREAENYLEG